MDGNLPYENSAESSRVRFIPHWLVSHKYVLTFLQPSEIPTTTNERPASPHPTAPYQRAYHGFHDKYHSSALGPFSKPIASSRDSGSADIVKQIIPPVVCLCLRYPESENWTFQRNFCDVSPQIFEPCIDPGDQPNKFVNLTGPKDPKPHESYG